MVFSHFDCEGVVCILVVYQVEEWRRIVNKHSNCGLNFELTLKIWYGPLNFRTCSTGREPQCIDKFKQDRFIVLRNLQLREISSLRILRHVWFGSRMTDIVIVCAVWSHVILPDNFRWSASLDVLDAFISPCEWNHFV